MSKKDNDEEWRLPKAPKGSKKTEYIVHCADSSDALIQPKSLESWNSLLAAIRVQHHTAILEV